MRRLQVFGFAATDAFDREHSDVNLPVEYKDTGDRDLFHRYLGPRESLEVILAPPVDLAMGGARRNPHFIESVDRSRLPGYVVR